MKRLTKKRDYPLTMSMWVGESKDLKIYNRLAEIENILGDDYDLERLKELVEIEWHNKYNKLSVEEFLLRVFGTETKSVPDIWIYDGRDCNVESGSDDGLFVIFKSCYIPKISLSKELLKKEVVQVMRTDYGLAICVEDSKEEHKNEN